MIFHSYVNVYQRVHKINKQIKFDMALARKCVGYPAMFRQPHVSRMSVPEIYQDSDINKS